MIGNTEYSIGLSVGINYGSVPTTNQEEIEVITVCKSSMMLIEVWNCIDKSRNARKIDWNWLNSIGNGFGTKTVRVGLLIMATPMIYRTDV